MVIKVTQQNGIPYKMVKVEKLDLLLPCQGRVIDCLLRFEAQIVYHIAISVEVVIA